MKSLAFVGCNISQDVFTAVVAHDMCWLFEPLEDIAVALAEHFDAPEYRDKCIKIVNAAVYSDCEPRTLSVYNVNGLSSSLGTITQQAKELYSGYSLDLKQERQVMCTRLADYLPLRLTTLIIDAQGCDLEILKSIEPWLAEGRIELIQAEADGQGATLYENLPSNDESEMLAYMSQFDYECERVPNKVAWNPDFRWRLK